jgi:predicted transcriptional regulator
MSHDPYTGTARVSFKCSDDLATMLRAAGRYEHRSESAICRIALAHYFTDQGYFDPANIAILAAGKK